MDTACLNVDDGLRHKSSSGDCSLCVVIIIVILLHLY